MACWEERIQSLDENLQDPLKIYLFASRLNHKLPVDVSWSPDPDAAFIDAFTLECMSMSWVFQK